MALATSPRTEPSSERALRVVPTPDGRGDDDAPKAMAAQKIHLRLTRIRTGSVTLAALALGLVVAVALTLTGIVAWWAASRAGMVTGVEEAVASGLGLEAWDAPAGALLVGWIAVVAGLTVLAVVFVVLLTIAFNGLARATRGLHVEAQARPASS